MTMLSPTWALLLTGLPGVWLPPVIALHEVPTCNILWSWRQSPGLMACVLSAHYIPSCILVSIDPPLGLLSQRGDPSVCHPDMSEASWAPLRGASSVLCFLTPACPLLPHRGGSSWFRLSPCSWTLYLNVLPYTDLQRSKLKNHSVSIDFLYEHTFINSSYKRLWELKQ